MASKSKKRRKRAHHQAARQEPSGTSVSQLAPVPALRDDEARPAPEAAPPPATMNPAETAQAHAEPAAPSQPYDRALPPPDRTLAFDESAPHADLEHLFFHRGHSSEELPSLETPHAWVATSGLDERAFHGHRRFRVLVAAGLGALTLVVGLAMAFSAPAPRPAPGAGVGHVR